MAVIDTEQVVTVSDLVTELGVSIPTARGIVADLTEVATINRTHFYDRGDVKRELYERNRQLLDFLGYLSLSESYDVTVSTDA